MSTAFFGVPGMFVCFSRRSFAMQRPPFVPYEVA